VDIANSLIFVLFENFVRLLSALVEFHSVVQMMTALVHVLIPKLQNCATTTVEKSNTLLQSLLFVGFIFGKFASTLVMGGSLSEFEQKSLWLIRGNIILIDREEALANLCSSELHHFEDERLELFLNGDGDTIPLSYQKIKSAFHRQLSPEILELDRLSMTAFSKHTNCLTELLFDDGSLPLSAALKHAFDRMLRV
jgi:hypothetical protein